ncbi:hypothetical protein ACFFX1_16085 [Dactylosporangium sucinum]|uniref:Uncharacterized protein n=1 Tax=Dactylosporangium sucinum TaxID=1424081 RepID=A0A917TL16_9ACTN|nr:hypothetical protein [Dactylosporangium sucinum]GGM27185.1 hypothetical protein GCM10007977_030520 [Dactylosporangium sucinum]
MAASRIHESGPSLRHGDALVADAGQADEVVQLPMLAFLSLGPGRLAEISHHEITHPARTP